MSQYKLLQIILLESHFTRNLELNVNEENNQVNVDAVHEIIEDDNKLKVTLNLLYINGNKKSKEIQASVRMLGIFEFDRNGPLPAEQFGRVNGPAILFPFLREHLASVSMKAGIAPILIPPINFIKKAAESKETNI